VIPPTAETTLNGISERARTGTELDHDLMTVIRHRCNHLPRQRPRTGRDRTHPPGKTQEPLEEQHGVIAHDP
jgi:hypothetical protein